MIELGFHLSSEEHPTPDLVGQAQRAEEWVSRTPPSPTTSIPGRTGRGSRPSSGRSSELSPEAVAELVSEEQVAEWIVCGADPERHLARIGEFVEAGFDHVHVHQVGADQETFFRFYEREVRPRVSEL